MCCTTALSDSGMLRLQPWRASPHSRPTPRLLHPRVSTRLARWHAPTWHRLSGWLVPREGSHCGLNLLMGCKVGAQAEAAPLASCTVLPRACLHAAHSAHVQLGYGVPLLLVADGFALCSRYSALLVALDLSL
eukprot:jgi/Ulvmu1/11325/UM074_0040.1